MCYMKNLLFSPGRFFNNEKAFRWLVALVVSAVILFVTSASAWADFTRKDVEFNAEEITLRGWLYLPKEAKGRVPAVVMAHGFSAVKEMWLDKYAEVFANAGMAALVYDHRNFGASDGKPRQELNAWAQVRDYRHAITYAQSLPEVDPERIGIWGTSFSGGHVLVVGAIDKRVKAVVSQVPITKLRWNYAPGGPLAGPGADPEAGPAMIPVVSQDRNAPCVLPQAESWEWFTKTAKLRAPSWRNEVTLRSLDLNVSYVPWPFAHQIGPIPLLMIVATRDVLCATDQALETYQRALEPKKLVLIPGGHFVPYVEQFDKSSRPACDWFVEHLKP